MLTAGFLTATVPFTSTLAPPLAAAAGGGVTLDLDKTVLVQMVLFMVLIVVLKPLLFDPVLRVFEQREQRTEGARAEARALQEKAGELLRKYEKELERLKHVATEERERLRAEASKLEAEILSQAREASNRIVEEGRSRIDREVQAIEKELSARTDELARSMASRVLGREAP
jgi:F-type H+-transporting ATPase subunit b